MDPEERRRFAEWRPGCSIEHADIITIIRITFPLIHDESSTTSCRHTEIQEQKFVRLRLPEMVTNAGLCGIVVALGLYSRRSSRGELVVGVKDLRPLPHQFLTTFILIDGEKSMRYCDPPTQHFIW